MFSQLSVSFLPARPPAPLTFLVAGFGAELNQLSDSFVEAVGLEQCNTIRLFGSYNYVTFGQPRIRSDRPRDSFAIEFRTSQTDGVIHYDGDADGGEFVALVLAGGKVEYAFNLGGETTTLQTTRNVADDAWHKVAVVREGANVRIRGDRNSPPVCSTPNSDCLC